MNRRELLARFGVAGLVAAVPLFESRSAEAFRTWCKSDPIFWYANGEKVKVTVSVDAENEAQVIGNIEIDALHPGDNPLIRVVTMGNINGYHEEVTDAPYWPTIDYEIWVPSASIIPVYVGVARDNGSTHLYVGESNSYIATY